jgi:acyl transferase domain-containing protein
MDSSHSTDKSKHRNEAIAIVGMACTFPKAPDLNRYWHNILNKVDAIAEAPADRWDASRFYDPKDGTKLYARRGGYLQAPLAFDAAEFGVMPSTVRGGEPDQFLVLKTAVAAMHDAGIKNDPALERADFILGRGAYLSAGGFNLLQRTLVVDQTVSLVGKLHPKMNGEDLQRLRDGLLASLLPFEADTAPSVMPNITAGRVSNRLGFMGPNYTIDAACASSLFAVDIAVANLRAGRADLALAGGVHIFNNIPFLSVFCALGAMSRSECIRPFDKNADGLLPGEGVGIVVLKRLADAERDGNRIYALIRGVGSSSDGRGGSVSAPRVAGEALAVQRAYDAAGVSPQTIGLIEAHGTATIVGDATEVESLKTVFGAKAEGTARSCALGSVKSMIGHAMPAAGIAGLIKTALALYHKVLPPTLHCEAPNPRFELEATPFYINTATRPWFRLAPDVPRRAGVNAFGFGGVNAHVVLEEHAATAAHEVSHPAWDTALFLFSGQSQAELARDCEAALAHIENNASLDWLAWSREVVRAFRPAEHRLAVIAEGSDDLCRKLRYAAQKLQPGDCKKIKDVKGIYYFAAPLGAQAKMAFMFPGEGSPYANMLLDLCLVFPEVRAVFESVDAVILSRTQKNASRPSQFIFPATLLTPAETQSLEAQFWKVDSGLQAILGASLAMHALLARFGVHPDMIVGHSAGEYCAWIASGILELDDLYRHQERIAGIYGAHRHPQETAMVAVSSHFDKIQPMVEGIGGEIYISNDNCPHQVVAVGAAAAVAQLKERLKAQNILYTDLPSREVHHTPLAAPQGEPLLQTYSQMAIHAARVPAYSATTAAPYPDQAQQIVRLMTDYWLQRLNFRRTVEAMYQDGARIFIEVGPGTNLCGFVDDTLRGKPFMTVAANSSRRSGIGQLCHLLGMLVAQHMPVRLDAYDPLPWHAASEQGPSPGAAKPKSGTVFMDLGLREMKLAQPAVEILQKRLNGPALAAPAPSVQTEAQRPAPARPQAASAMPPSAPVSPKDQVMQRYLDNMAQFLALQKQIMTGWTAPRPARPVTERPFAQRVISLSPGQACRVQCDVDLKKERFLEDHPIVGSRMISDGDPALLPLIITPMTLNLEIMAEAASLLHPGHLLLEVKNGKAHRWVEVPEEGPTTIDIQARQDAGGEVQTRLFAPAFSVASAEVTAVFGVQYPPSAMGEAVNAEQITPEVAARAREIYARKYMAHGPRFQVIAGWTQVGAGEVEAYLQAPADHDLLADIRAPRLLLNPLLLDGCAQLVGHWAQICLREKFITFPAGVQHIRFFSDPPRPGQLLKCRMRISEIDEHHVRADLKLTGHDGRQWVTVQGWTHRRFALPQELYSFCRFPKTHILAQWAEGQKEPRLPGDLTCRQAHYPELNRTIWKKGIGMLFLNRAERRMYKEKLSCDETGAERWLTERMTAKEAVRLYLKQYNRAEIFPADIEIEEIDGRLIPKDNGLSDLNRPLSITISHTEQFAAACMSQAAETIKRESAQNE